MTYRLFIELISLPFELSLLLDNVLSGLCEEFLHPLVLARVSILRIRLLDLGVVPRRQSIRVVMVLLYAKVLQLLHRMVVE